MKEKLAEYLAFRHFYSNSYSRVRQSKAILGTRKNYESSNHADLGGYTQANNLKKRRHLLLYGQNLRLNLGGAKVRCIAFPEESDDLGVETFLG